VAFPCTSCGACCAFVRGRAYEEFKPKGWILPSGACINYDFATKLCKIYDSRPTVCRVDALRPSHLGVQQWYDFVEDRCDEAHVLVYGTKRERLKREYVVSDELKGKRALLAVPTYGQVDPLCAKMLRIAMMGASNRGLRWVGDASPDRQGWSAARNSVAQVVADDPDSVDGIVWVDSDIRVPPDAIVRLLVHSLDFVSGLYHQRAPVHNPVFYGWSDKKQMFQPADDYLVDVVAPTDGCGFGFVWTSTKTIMTIAKHKDFDSKGGWFKDLRDGGGFGEDLNFCRLAMKAGIQLHIDTGIQVGHAGELGVVTREDFLREKAKLVVGAAPETQRTWGVK